METTTSLILSFFLKQSKEARENPQSPLLQKTNKPHIIHWNMKYFGKGSSGHILASLELVVFSVARNCAQPECVLVQ